MANEITHNYLSGSNLYICRFKQNGNVFLTDGSSAEVWGSDGHDADDYDVAMAEESTSGHYKGSFDTAPVIPAGVYQVTIYERAGANPVNGDTAIAQGSIVWDGTEESSLAGAVHDEIIEGTLTSREAMRLVLAILVGLTSGGGTDTLVFRDTGDTKDRVVATVDKDGNRIFIIKDVT